MRLFLLNAEVRSNTKAKNPTCEASKVELICDCVVDALLVGLTLIICDTHGKVERCSANTGDHKPLQFHPIKRPAYHNSKLVLKRNSPDDTSKRTWQNFTMDGGSLRP